MFKIFDKLEKFSIEPNTFKSIIVGLAFCLSSIDIIYLYISSITNTSNLITILTSIFTVLVTFISIIFVYFNFFDNSISEKLANQLHEIEYFAYTFTNVELKKANHTFNPKNNNYPYKEYYECLESCYSKYSYLYDSLKAKSEIIYALYQLCVFISFSAIILLIIDFLIIKVVPLLTIILLSIIFSSNLYLIQKVIKQDENNKKLFPSPDELLTPTTILNEKLCKIYNLDKKLPLKLFHVSTSFLVRDLNEIKDKKLLDNYFANFNYNKNHRNCIKLNSIFPFKIKELYLTYSYNIFDDGKSTINNDTTIYSKQYSIRLGDDKPLNISKSNRIFIRYPIINDFQNKKNILKNKLQEPKTWDEYMNEDKKIRNSLDDVIILKIPLSPDEQVKFYYRISSIISSPNYLFYAPTYIYENNKHEEIQTTNIYTYNTYNTYNT